MDLGAFIAVMLGCALGGMARYAVASFVGHCIGESFPWGTLAVNVSGAFAIGIVAAAVMWGPAWSADPNVWRFAAIGFLGSYTTVSSFSLQTLALLRDRSWFAASANLALSFGLCLTAAALGLAAGSRLFGG